METQWQIQWPAEFSNQVVLLAANLLVQSTILIGAGLLIAWLCRSRGVALKSLILRATLVAVLGAPVCALLLAMAGISGMRLGIVPGPLFAGSDDAPVVSSGDRQKLDSQWQVPARVGLSAGPPEPSVETDRLGANEPTASSAIFSWNSRPNGGSDNSAASRSGDSHWYGALTPLWVLGSLLLLGRLGICHWRIHRLRCEADMAEVSIYEECDAIAKEMGVATPEVLAHRGVKSPLLVGLCRPAILLPQLARAGHGVATREVLVHELAHLRRMDCLWRLLSCLATALLFFQPLLWLLARKIEESAEEVCDNYVIELASDRRSYARQLVELAERQQFGYGEAMAGVGVIAFKSGLGQRIVRILDSTRKVSLQAGLPAMVLTSLAVTLASGVVGLASASAEPAASWQVKRGQQKGAEKLAGNDELVRRGLASSSEQRSTNRKDVLPAPEAAVQKGLSLRVQSVPDPFLWGETAISRDGRFMITSRYNPKLIEKLDLKSGVVQIIATQSVSSAILSRDGRQIAASGYYNSQSTNHVRHDEIVLIELETGNIRRLCQPEEANYIKMADWSEDGGTILFIFKKGNQSRSWHIATVSATDGSVKVVKTLERFALGSSASLSPDGKWVVYDSPVGANDHSPRNLFLIPADGSSQEAPLVEHPADDFVLGWAPAGDQVLFASDRRQSCDAFTIRVANGRPDGEAEFVKSAIGRGRQLGFTANGAFFYRVESSPKDVYLATLDPASGKVQGKPSKVPFSREGHTSYPDWSHDGRFLSCAVSAQGTGSASGSGLICVRDMVDGTERDIRLVGGQVWAPRWSRDGTFFIASGIERQRYAFFSVDAQTGKTEWLPVRPGTSLMAGWSPDGAAFYYQTGRSIKRRELNSGSETSFPLATNALGIAYSEHCSAVLSHDARQIVFKCTTSTNSDSIYAAELQGGEPRLLASVSTNYWIRPYEILWTPDDRYVIYVKTLRGNSESRSITLCRVKASGGPEEELGELTEGAENLRLAPDGRRLAFTVSKTTRDIWVLENFLPAQKTAAK